MKNHRLGLAARPSARASVRNIDKPGRRQWLPVCLVRLPNRARLLLVELPKLVTLVLQVVHCVIKGLHQRWNKGNRAAEPHLRVRFS